VIRAKRREIARRYSRPKRAFTTLERVLALRRAQLVRLFESRGGLQDNEAGRADLRLLLDHGLTGPKAAKLAPWLAPDKLQRLIDVADADPQRWNASALGNRVGLTFEEKVTLRIWHINCFDRPKHEVRAFLAAHRRKRDAERKRLKRRRQSAERAAQRTDDRRSPRARAVLAFLRDSPSIVGESTGDIALGVCSSPAFKGLSPESINRAIRRAVRELVDEGIVGAYTYKRSYGLPVKTLMVRVVRPQPAA
jgi:hypothetical protein